MQIGGREIGAGRARSSSVLSAFAPVPRARTRMDGWTAAKQRGFIAALAETGSVSGAAAAVGMAAKHAYSLRRHPHGEGFRTAWDAAINHAMDRIEDGALERAIHGVVEPVFRAGKQIGTRRVINDRLAMFMLRHRRPERYGESIKLDDLQPGSPIWEDIRARVLAEEKAREAAEVRQPRETMDQLIKRLQLRLGEIEAAQTEEDYEAARQDRARLVRAANDTGVDEGGEEATAPSVGSAAISPSGGGIGVESGVELHGGFETKAAAAAHARYWDERQRREHDPADYAACMAALEAEAAAEAAARVEAARMGAEGEGTVPQGTVPDPAEAPIETKSLAAVVEGSLLLRNACGPDELRMSGEEDARVLAAAQVSEADWLNAEAEVQAARRARTAARAAQADSAAAVAASRRRALDGLDAGDAGGWAGEAGPRVRVIGM